MSTGVPEGEPKVPERNPRHEALRKEFITRFGDTRGKELFRQLEETTLHRVGPGAWIGVFDSKDVQDVVGRIWKDGLAGLSAAELLKIDDLLSKTVYRRRLILRFLKHYIEDDEYSAVDTAFQLVSIIRDHSGHVANRRRLVRSLYDRLDRLRYGNRILNQVSVGWLESVTYPRMRALETGMTPAGRATGPEAEAIKQVFYHALTPDRTRMWIRASDDSTEVFGEIAYRLLRGGPEVPYLDVHATATAERVRDAAVEDFLGSYAQFEGKRVDLGPGGVYVHISRKERP